MNRAYFQSTVYDFLDREPDQILGEITRFNEFALEDTQRAAWIEQTKLLKTQLVGLDGQIYFEFSIPRMGKRVDVILLIGSVIFVIEFKVGSSTFYRSDVDQVTDYALDLRNFHEGSHYSTIVPILIATEAKDRVSDIDVFSNDKLSPLCINGQRLASLISNIIGKSSGQTISVSDWESSGYKPTPTIIEATLALYNGHSVVDISRSDAGAVNLSITSQTVSQLIESARNRGEKAIVFVTGVPGAGKTLVGLNIATKYIDDSDDLYSVFLSGNGPLVAILQEALARDKVSKENIRITKARSEVKAFIQNVHHFRDEGLRDRSKKPPEHVVLFDEAQRAWNRDQTIDFMKRKKGQPDFEMSEPEFLVSCMDRHDDWAVVVCLVGGGQEINKGEAGIRGWFEAVRDSFPKWKVYASNQLQDKEYGGTDILGEFEKDGLATLYPSLHLKSSMRSFRSERVSDFVKLLLDLETDHAKSMLAEIKEQYPIVLTRDINKARNWLKSKASGNERYGILVSSQAERLRPLGVHVKAPIDPVKWFLEDKDHVRSSYYLEEVATEFHVQGLELDWACVAWDADFRYSDEGWGHWSFRGKAWQRIIKPERQIYQKNAYRVLLTRARQGMVIVVPEGGADDHTRPSSYYDSTYKYLEEMGLRLL